MIVMALSLLIYRNVYNKDNYEDCYDHMMIIDHNDPDNDHNHQNYLDDNEDNDMVKRMTNKRRDFCLKASVATKIDQGTTICCRTVRELADHRLIAD